MDNPEKLVKWGTQDEEKQNKNTIQYVLDTTIREKNTNNVNKICAPYKQLAVKTSIVFMRKS